MNVAFVLQFYSGAVLQKANKIINLKSTFASVKACPYRSVLEIEFGIQLEKLTPTSMASGIFLSQYWVTAVEKIMKSIQDTRKNNFWKLSKKH
jgi:hypothetical protein